MNRVYSVTQITQYIKKLFAEDYLLPQVSVSGEITGLKDHPSGHLYFTIRDRESELSVVLFAGQRRTALKTVPKEGQKVIVTGNIDIYPPSGKYQLYAKKIEADGEGERYLEFLALKKKLEEMGMFDPSYKKPIPKYAMTVGVVTASSGAALQDVIRVTRERNPFVKLVLSPCAVQGNDAPLSIVNAIRKMDAFHPDVMIVGRGGGSENDLFCFNDERVARAIFDCETPVISAVGHEVDFTIADFVADYRAATPSQAAETAVFDLQTFRNYQNQLLGAMERVLSHDIQKKRERLRTMEKALKVVHPLNQVREKLLRVDDLSGRLSRAITEKIRALRERTTLVKPRLTAAIDRQYRNTEARFKVLSTKLNALSPLAKLTGGYGYIEKAGVPVKSIRTLKKGDCLTVQLSDGTAETEVTEVKGNDHE